MSTTPCAEPSETFQVNWGLGTAHLKLQTAGTPTNALSVGSYTASVVLTPNRTPDASCAGGPCAIHMLGPDHYEIFYTYTVTSQSSAGTFARRAVTLSGSFSAQLRLHSFAMYALFTDTHTSPSGGGVWFTSNTNFSGPVHTNGEFQFAFFPTFTDKIESLGAKAWFNNGGSPLTKYTVTPFIGTTAQTPTTVTGSPPATSVTVSGLSAGTTYTFKVSATNAVGTGPQSAASNAVTPCLLLC